MYATATVCGHLRRFAVEGYAPAFGERAAGVGATRRRRDPDEAESFQRGNPPVHCVAENPAGEAIFGKGPPVGLPVSGEADMHPDLERLVKDGRSGLVPNRITQVDLRWCVGSNQEGLAKASA